MNQTDPAKEIKKVPPPGPTRVLFVCMGNICRSPAAEGIFRHYLSVRGLEGKLICDSAGTLGDHAGEKPDKRMMRAAAKRGYELGALRARQFEIADFDRFDVIVAMDPQNHDTVARWARSEEHRAKLTLMGRYHPEPDVTEVPDPYHGPAVGFERVLDILEAACRRLMEDLLRKGDAAKR